MSISFLAHIPNTDSRLLLTNNMMDCTCTCPFYPPTTLAKATTRKLTFVCSSQRVLPIEKLLQLSVVDVGPSNASTVDLSDYLSNGNGVVALGDSLSEEVLKERS